MFKKFLTLALAALMLLPLCCFNASAADGVISEGKDYTVEYYTETANAYPKKAYKAEKKLTDGKTAKSASMSDSAWLELYRGTAVAVTIDLGEVMAVSRATIGELQYKSAGIRCSRYLEIYVSENGSDYGFAGRVDAPQLITDSVTKKVSLDLKLDKSYKARYVRAVFSSDVFTYVDEVSVYGSKDVSSAATAEAYKPEDKSISGDIDGIKSVCLMYTASSYNVQTIKPYFAYVDGTGKVKDTMFDSLLFLAMPITSSADGNMRQQDMQNFVSTAFSKDLNVGALNTVVGELKGELGLGDDYKYPIFVSVPKVALYNGTFGTIDGKSVISNTLEARTQIVEWYVDYVISEFGKAGFDNLTLKGFYWFPESIDYSVSTHEEELVKNFNSICHEKGYKTMWIPYFSSSGIDVSKSLGFDSVTMQVGHAFEGGAEVGASLPTACTDATAAIKKYGLNGLEFEVDCNVKEYTKRFARYVSAAYGAGIMENGMITMYQVGDHLYRSSTGAYAREIYDLTYEFISGKYKEYAPVIEGDVTVTVKQGDFERGKFVVSDEDTSLANLFVVGLEKIEGLYIEAYGNGRINVDASKAAPGTYETEFAVTDGINTSNTVKLTVIVEPNGENGGEGEESTENSSDANTDNTNKNGGNVILYVVIAVVAAIVIAVVLIFVFRKKNK